MDFYASFIDFICILTLKSQEAIFQLLLANVFLYVEAKIFIKSWVIFRKLKKCMVPHESNKLHYNVIDLTIQ